VHWSDEGLAHRFIIINHSTLINFLLKR
jgi:hypothetical protein